jgi:hypothetical protein
MNLPYRGDNDPTLCTEASSWAYPMCTCIFMNLPYRGDNDPTLYTEASLWTYPIEETTSLSYEQKHLYAPTLCTEAFLWAYPIEETASSSTCSANYRTFHSFFLNSWIYSKPTQPLLILTTNRYLFLSIKFSSYKFTTLHFSFTFLSLHNSPFFSQGVKILSQYSPPPQIRYWHFPLPHYRVSQHWLAFLFQLIFSLFYIYLHFEVPVFRIRTSIQFCHLDLDPNPECGAGSSCLPISWENRNLLQARTDKIFF